MAVRRMFVLDYGTACVDKGRVLTSGKDVGVIVPTPIWGTLLDTDDGWVLVDTGMHPEHVERYDARFSRGELAGKIVPVMREINRADRQVYLCGVKADDIEIVINTHLHFDHCGGNCLFPRARFFVQGDHYRWALESSQCFREDFGDVGDRWVLLDGDVEVVSGVKVVRTPGHVPGHQSVIVSLAGEGVVILAGDAVVLWETVSGNAVTAWDPAEYRASARRLVKLAEDLGGRVFPGHEQNEWVRWRRAPEFYQ